MTTGRVKVIDLFSQNDFYPSDILAQGYIGVIFKCGQGQWADVPRYKADWPMQARAAELLVGWYWLCDSRYPSPGHMDELRRFFPDLTVLNDELGFWVDVEKPQIAMSETDYWKTPYAGVDNIIDFCYLLTLEGVKVGIYTGPGAFELVTRDASSADLAYLAQFLLWTAQYLYNYIDGVSQPSMYGAWNTWEFWQIREGPDENIYNGADNAFYAKYGQPILPDGDPMPTTTHYGTVKTSSLRVRSGPGTTYEVIGYLSNGDQIQASEISNDWWKITKRNNIPSTGWAFANVAAGPAGEYIHLDRTETVEPPPNPVDAVVSVNVAAVVDGVNYVPDTIAGNVITLRKA